MNIYLVSGKVHSGKTGKLMLWVYKRPDARGVLAPVIEGKRYLMNVRTKTARLLTADANDPNSVSVGDYRFSNETFEWGRQILRQAFKENAPWIVADEIGPLELNNQGLEPTISEWIAKSKNNDRINLVLVVRESLVEKVLQHFGLSRGQVKDFSFPLEP